MRIERNEAILRSLEAVRSVGMPALVRGEVDRNIVLAVQKMSLVKSISNQI